MNICAEDAGTYALEVQDEKQSKSLARLICRKEAKFTSSINSQEIELLSAFDLSCKERIKNTEKKLYYTSN